MSSELIADGGTAAVEAEFFRSSEFLGAEAVTHTLRASDGEGSVLVPVIVRAIAGSERLDAISPYGYPSARLEGDPVDAAAVDWSGSGLVSLFIRDRVHGAPCFSSPTERGPVLVSDPRQERKSRMSDRQQIRRNESDGYAVRHLSGPDAGEADRASLHTTYTQTMHAVGAAERYLFDRAYFDRLLDSPLAELFVVDAPVGPPAAAAIAVRSDGALHYYLSGTAEDHRRASPSKNLIAAVTDHADQLGLPMSLGGGVEPGDALEQFKRGFANCELPNRTHEIVCDPAAYSELCGDRPAAGYFPAYRAPVPPDGGE